MSALLFNERLALSRELIAAGWAGSRLPEHIQDQLEAAADECEADLRQVGVVVAFCEPTRRWRQHRSGGDPEQRALLLASLLDCMALRCPHLRTGSSPQPAYALLPLRRLSCRRCVGILRRPPPEDSDRCDVCGRRGVTTFFAFCVAVGATLISGDACSDCAGVLGIRAVAA